MTDVVGKLWGFCHTLRHDGIDHGDYIEQITYLLFLKMAAERGLDLSRVAPRAPRGELDPVDCSWPALRAASGQALLDRYAEVLRSLERAPGVLGEIYAGSQPRFKSPANLQRLVDLIDEIEWTGLGVDIQAAAYEGLLEKAAAEGKKGAGQYFTPRVLIQSIVRCMRPDPRGQPGFALCDPACGTGGFLVAAWEWLEAEARGALDRETADRIKSTAFFGHELVARPRRLALMNLVLHGIEPRIALGDSIDAPPPAERFDVILTNPPFGTKGARQTPGREDFAIATANKQLNFIQHVLTILKPGGRAAMVLPDNCLFADQAGAVFEILAEGCDLHTVLRLPRGTFTPYSPGVKANVVFFTKGRATEKVWIYDARTGVPSITKKDRPLSPAHFAEFERCYGDDPDGRAGREAASSREGRFRSFDLREIEEREFKLDGFKWLREESPDDAGELPEPEELATDAILELEEAVAALGRVLALLEGGAKAADA
ncbi:HsdM family class I SAM-dependent methyltransferase [Sorangium cellulosum]|uniref:site-specific DNA-methyltransferase (adenine-specific) n=1 Tax=Sorangium cellulosum So0157-2 TaxID=1254432 RepID=S4Y458_SORCE|nr:class I SAM-dependent DNA methyltransferase [Sorangium cellulosum]AGP38965.1 restriction endonuclease subunit S [Sorangium cellulosum So0157-2]